ncbi:MAG: methyltransferase domain-containing protein [Candidatus Methanogasteraceae archaeon]
MLLAFELSGEHETLPAGEVLACMRSLGIEHTVVKSEGQCLILKIVDETPAISTLPSLLSARLAMTHHIIAVINECDPSESSILKSVSDAEITIPRGETFSVRARKMQKFALSTERVERLIGGVIFERNRVNGVSVNLTSPDHRFRAILTDDSCIFGEVLASVDRGGFEERKPHKKPFFYPGAISPKVARAIVNLCEIRTGDRVLDPFCGTGGILVEAGMIGASVIGIDVQESMVHGARMNLKDHGFEYQLICGDSCNLPLRDQSIDVVVTDPPYGRSAVVMAESIVSLYRDALFEMHRVIVEGGHAVVVSDFELPWVDEVGFTTIELHTQRVHRSLTRHIVVLEK